MIWIVRRTLLLFGLLSLATSQSDLVTCYFFNGREAVNQRQCKGSYACCGADAECLPNRLCKSADSRDPIRGPCLVHPFDDTCAQVCNYNESNDNPLEDNRFPRVEQCSDGSWCCNNDPQCCRDNRGTFLDERGKQLASAPSSIWWLSSTATASTESPSTSPSQISSSPPYSSSTPTQSQDVQPTSGSNSNLDNGEALALKVGLGVGIPFVAVIAALATWCLSKKHRNKKKRPSELADHHHPYPEPSFGNPKSPGYNYTPHQDDQSPGLDGRHEILDRPAYERSDAAPQELMGVEMHEAQGRQG